MFSALQRSPWEAIPLFYQCNHLSKHFGLLSLKLIFVKIKTAQKYKFIMDPFCKDLKAVRSLSHKHKWITHFLDIIWIWSKPIFSQITTIYTIFALFNLISKNYIHSNIINIHNNFRKFERLQTLTASK